MRMRDMKKVVLCPNPYRDKGLQTARKVERLLQGQGLETCMSVPYRHDGSFSLPKGVTCVPIAQALRGADLMICFGGDGTILHCAREAGGFDVPLLGVNMGSVGFMAELESSELDLLGKIAAGDFTVEERMMLDVKVYRDGETVYSDTAFNDVLINKAAAARLIQLSVFSGAEGESTLAAFSGDGVILSTPTGSTAYSMSAGGPIVEPASENIILTPVCAHSLYVRPLVLAPERIIRVELTRPTRRTALLSVDGGKIFRIRERDQVIAARSPKKTKLARLTNRSFYDVLYQKFGKSLDGGNRDEA